MSKRYRDGRAASFYYGRRYQVNAILLGILATAALFFLLTYLTNLHPYIIWVICMSITTFAMFGIDKALSKTDQARIPEVVLHIFTLLGGFPGQWLGRTVFHHKTNFEHHPAFRIVLIVSLVLNGIVAYLLLF